MGRFADPASKVRLIHLGQLERQDVSGARTVPQFARDLDPTTRSAFTMRLSSAPCFRVPPHQRGSG
jgi:hypothetical protein